MAGERVRGGCWVSEDSVSEESPRALSSTQPDRVSQTDAASTLKFNASLLYVHICVHNYFNGHVDRWIDRERETTRLRERERERDREREREKERER